MPRKLYAVPLMIYKELQYNNKWKVLCVDDGPFNRQLILMLYKMSHVMRKPVYALCEQQRRRSACASMQSDQHLCCSLPR